MVSVNCYYKINDNEIKNLFLNIFGDNLVPFPESAVHSSIVFIEESCLTESEISSLLKDNLVIILKDEADKGSENNLKHLTLYKNFIISHQRQLKDLVYFLLYFYEEHIEKIHELEEKIFNLAFSSVDLLETHEILSERLNTDGLTGLYNHTAFQDRLKKLFDNYQTHNHFFSIAILDIDFFKKVNDKYGHLKGDEVLKTFANLIKESIRANDFPARYGGEEFGIIFSGTNKYQAKKILERLRDNVKKVEFTSEKEKFSITFSAGIAEINSNLSNTADLIRLADEAMYFSKNTGRDRITLA